MKAGPESLIEAHEADSRLMERRARQRRVDEPESTVLHSARKVSLDAHSKGRMVATTQETYHPWLVSRRATRCTAD